MADFSNSYPLDPSWTLKFSKGISIDQLANKIGMTVEQLLGKTLNNNNSAATLRGWDYVILILFLLSSVVIGLYFALVEWLKKRKMSEQELSVYAEAQAQEYLLAGRKLSAFPVALSMTASFISALTVLGVPAEFYAYGTMFYWSGVCFLFVTLLIGYVFCPIVYPLGISSAYEYFVIRFGDHLVETLAGISYLATTIVYMGVVTYAPCLALVQVTKINLWAAVSLTAVICTAYTTLGGLKAVIWSDVFQSLVIMIGFISIIAVGSNQFEGMGNILTINRESGRYWFNDFRPDPTIRTTFWSVVLGGTFGIWGGIYSSQSMVQRYLSCKDLPTVKRAFWINLTCLAIIIVLAGFTGHVAYAYFQFCDPVRAKFIGIGEQMIPYLSVTILDDFPGLSGLYVAGVYAGTLSTISSGINSVATVMLTNFIQPSIKNNGCWSKISHIDETKISKTIVFVTGFIIIGIAYITSLAGTSVLVAGLSALGTLGGPVLGCFLLGFTCPYADTFSTSLAWCIGNFNAIFCFLGIFLNSKNLDGSPPLPYEKNLQVLENCLCSDENLTGTEKIEDYLANGLKEEYNCLNNKTYVDIFDQETPKRGFFEFLWHMSPWHLGFVGSLSVYIVGWIATIFRLKVLKRDMSRGEDRTLLGFLRVNKEEVYDSDEKH